MPMEWNGYGYKLMKKHVSARVFTVGYFLSIMLDYVPISMLNSPFVVDKQRSLSVPNRRCRLALSCCLIFQFLHQFA